MGIEFKPTFTMGDIRRKLETAQARIDRATFEALSHLGEECVNRARDIKPPIGFMDRTGNLRSSMGYAIAKDGNIVKYSNFNVIEGGGEGATKGRNLTKTIAGEYPAGWVLIVVAGMNYAVYVEAKGRDVLSSAEHFAESEVKVVMSMLKKSINRMKV